MAPVVGAAILVVVGVAAGCLTTEQMAPPVGPAFEKPAADRGVTLAALEQGRHVYVTSCARCHSVEPIDRYSSVEWDKIIPRMARLTKLSRDEREALSAYVATAWDVMQRPPQERR